MSQKRAQRNDGINRPIFYLLGVIFSIIPVIFTIITYFPIWRAKSAVAVFSGGALLLIAIALIPLYRIVREYLRSPSVPAVWFTVFILFSLIASIADEMVVISFIGFIGNLIGSVFFKLAKRSQKGSTE